MNSERLTESIVRRHFEQFKSEVTIEEQKSSSRQIQSLLRNASKSESGQVGRPEFIISFNKANELIAVVECKASTHSHESTNLDQPLHFAVDGALHYASHLSRKFDVLAIAVSGTAIDRLKVSHYLQLKLEREPRLIFGSELLPPEDYILGYFRDEGKFRQDYESLQEFISELNNDLHVHKVSENHRSILISSILIALDREAFRSSYRSENSPNVLAKSVVDAAIAQLQEAGVNGRRLQVLKHEFSFLRNSQVLARKKHILRGIIQNTDEEVNTFVKNHKYRDVLGSLYIEFLRYANADKGLGIVLTPPHITDLFSDLAQVNPQSVVYDNCAGTGGFLISAMRKMIDDADGSQSIEQDIKHNRLYGVELQSSIYPLAVSNMYIHQDGKSNVFLGDCFDSAIVEQMRRKAPTIGLLNPPYKADKAQDTEELEFVLNNLECLQHGGTCVAILPMQSALNTTRRIRELKEKIMSEHTLEAVCSMPNDLFFNSDVKVISCIMVITAHRPHPPAKEVFLGYFKNDGFQMRKIGEDTILKARGIQSVKSG